MRVGWLADVASYVGGAELTQAEFRAAAPEGVEIVDCPVGGVVQGLDRYAVHNCVSYPPEDLMLDAPAFKYHNDVGSWLTPAHWAALNKYTAPICCSPLQAEYMRLDAALIPPPVNLERFTRADANSNGNRCGQVCVGSWRNLGKGPHNVMEWAAQHGGVDFYGDGPYAPHGSMPVAYENMPALLSRYQTFVFLPSVIEPFGRTVAEAWAAGCEIVTNGLVGATYWIQHHPEALDTAAADYWELVCGS